MLPEPWAMPCHRGVDILALHHPASHQALQPVLAAQELVLTEKLKARKQRSQANVGTTGSEHCLGLEGHAALGMSPTGWLQVPGEDKASASYLLRCLVTSRAPCIPLI